MGPWGIGGGLHKGFVVAGACHDVSFRSVNVTNAATKFQKLGTKRLLHASQVVSLTGTATIGRMSGADIVCSAVTLLVRAPCAVPSEGLLQNKILKYKAIIMLFSKGLTLCIRKNDT